MWISLVGQAQISFVDQRRCLQCVAQTFSAHMTMSEASEFIVDQRGQFRESSIVPVTPLRRELGHSLLRDRRRIHNLLFIPYHPPKISARGSVSGEISIQMITLIALSRLTAMETKQPKERKNNETTDPVQKNWSFTCCNCASTRAWARVCDRRVSGPSEPLDERATKVH